jgi:hypothetical protein
MAGTSPWDAQGVALARYLMAIMRGCHGVSIVGYLRVIRRQLSAIAEVMARLFADRATAPGFRLTCPVAGVSRGA